MANHKTQTPPSDRRLRNRRQLLRGAGVTMGGLILGSAGVSTVSASHLDISLGDDVTFTEMNREKRREEINGDVLLQEGGSTTYLASNRATATVEGLTGIGDIRFISSIGRAFKPRGEQAQDAIVTAEGVVSGVLDGVDIADQSVQGAVWFYLADHKTNTAIRTRAFRAAREGPISEQRIDEAYFQPTLEATLVPDRQYTAWIELVARIDSEIDVVDAKSDFGAEHGGAQVNQLDIIF